MVATVTDTGIGMSTEDLSRIFGEFFRSEAAREEVVLGTGLGLAIVNQIVKLYKGNIEVDSTPGDGSTFIITLPAADSDATADLS
jgi:signal transduction histidine kinase